MASRTGAPELCLRAQRSLARSSGRPGASTLGRFASSSQLFRASRRCQQLVESPLRHETTAADFDDGQLPKLDGAPHSQGVHAEQDGDLAKREREPRICFVGDSRRHKNLPRRKNLRHGCEAPACRVRHPDGPALPFRPRANYITVI